MSSTRTKILKYLLLYILIYHFPTVRSQTNSDSLKLTDLEKNIIKKVSLVKTYQELEIIKQQAVKSGDDMLLARCLYDLMELQDRRTEDTLYFRNSAFIDSLLNKNPSPRLKAILYVMHAQRLSKFDNRPKRFNYATYHTKGLNANYASLNDGQRDSIVANDLENALKYNGLKTDAKQLFWLSSNPGVFLFDPQFEDIILSEQVNLLALKGYFNYEQKKEMSTWLFLSSPAFHQKLDSLASDKINNNNILVGYQHWLSFNKANEEVSVYIESLTRKYIYLTTPEDSLVKRSYINYLLDGITSSYPVLKAHAVYQLCLIWNKDGNEYANFGNGFSYKPYSGFPTAYQYYPVKALQLYEKHKDLLYRYPVFDKVLNQMVKQIKSAGIRIEMEDKYLPQEPIAIKAIYKNTDTLFYRIIRVNFNEAQRKDGASAISQQVDQQPIAQGKFILPLPSDHNKHSVYLKLEPLPTGHYHLLFGNTPIKLGEANLNKLAFEVTNIAAINTDEKIFVLNRKTGFPLVGADIRAFKKKMPVNKGVASMIRDNGYLNISEGVADSIYIAYKNDTSGYRFSIQTNSIESDNEVYDKEEYENLNEFYDDNLKMEIFTDRSIYRPGQTVYYKIIFFTNNPNTGDLMLFNRQNLGRGLFKNRLEEWLSEKNNLITLKNSFNKTIDSVRFTVNEFGSFTGSFKLPKSAATGNWNIDGYPYAQSGNSGDFEVEEYKRPTIELGMEKQKKRLMPGETFTIKLKLNSFSGANLNNTPINYTISRRGYLPSNHTLPANSYNSFGAIQIIKQNGYTDENGELLLSINDTALTKTNLSDSIVYNYTYELNATAVDVTGESAEITERIDISSYPIKINLPVAKMYDRQSLPNLNVTTSADFEGVVGSVVNVKLYKVTNPDRSGDKIKAVDQWYYSRAEWNSWFPDNATNAELKEERILVLDTLINTAAYEKLSLTKEKINTGFYELRVSCTAKGRIIGKSSYTFNVFDSKSEHIPVDDIDYLPFNSAKPGDMITWYSSGKNDSYTIYQVLYVTSGKKKVIKNYYQTVTEKAGVNKWEYRIPENVSGELLLNRITVRNNKIVTQENTIYINNVSSPPLDIVVEKYRKVMVPGVKETFTLSVKTNNDQVAAELMTTLYDASLDKLEEHHWYLPQVNQSRPYLNTDWNHSLTNTQNAGDYYIDRLQPASLQEFEWGTIGLLFLIHCKGK